MGEYSGQDCVGDSGVCLPDPNVTNSEPFGREDRFKFVSDGATWKRLCFPTDTQEEWCQKQKRTDRGNGRKCFDLVITRSHEMSEVGGDQDQQNWS